MENYEEKYNKAIDVIKRIKEVNKDNAELVDFIEYNYPELKGSEDEKIRKELIEALKQLDREKTPVDTYPYLEWIAWLEKQGEQKSIEKPKWYDSMDELIADALIELVEESDLIDRDKRNRIYWITKHRQKPVEWSEEDKTMLEDCIGAVAAADYYPYEDKQKMEKWLKSLEPQSHWKPSKEQMKRLQYAIRILKGVNEHTDAKYLEELFDDLKKL